MTQGANASVVFMPHSLMAGQANERAATEWPARMTARILIVDDSTIMRYAVSRLLSMEPGLEVVGEAADGLEAVTLTRALRPDFVVMDVSMPLMDGIEATSHIMKEHPDIIVIGFSTSTESHVRLNMLKAGAVDLLCKSDATNRLAPAIRRLWAERVFV